MRRIDSRGGPPGGVAVGGGRARALLIGAAALVFLLAIFAGGPGDKPDRNARNAGSRTEPPPGTAPSAPPAAEVAGGPAAPPAQEDRRTPRDRRPASPFPGAVAIAPRGTAQTAEPVELLRLPWGRHPGAIGLFVPGDEGLPVGPASFAVGADGRLYVADRVNRRITIFQPHGTVERVLDVDGHLADLVVDGEGRIHTLEYGTGLIRRLDPRTGAELSSVEVASLNPGSEPAEGLVVRDGEVFLRRVDQQLTPTTGGGWRPDRVVTHWPQGGPAHAGFAVGRNGETRVVPVEVDVDYLQGSVRYLGPAAGRGSWLLVETLSSTGEIESAVRRYSAEGEFIDAVSVPFRNLAQPDRVFTTDPAGALYQMTTDESGVRIVRWDFNR